MLTSPKEREFKFSSPANRQFKFATLEHSSAVTAKALAIFRILGIRTKDKGDHEIQDTYFDDHNGTLASNGFSLRFRQEQGAKLITIKLDSKAPKQTNHLERYEYEFPANEGTTSDNIPSLHVSQALQRIFHSNIQFGGLEAQISIVNR